MDRRICRGELYVRGPEFCRVFGPGSAVDFDALSGIVPGATWGQVLADDRELFEPLPSPEVLEAPVAEE